MKKYKNSREFFEKEWFVKANAIGVSWQDFWHMNPHIINLLLEGHNEKIKELDTLAWSFGHYVLSAVATSIENNFAKHPKAKYIKEPLMKEIERKNKPMTEEELQKQRELFVAQLQVMQANFELSHPKKDKDKGQ